MGKKLYVGNLSFSVTENTLMDMFSQHGTVDSVKIITDQDTNRSKGFGFIEMSTDEDAAEAIEKLNGFECEGRQMNVNEAKPQAPRNNSRNRFGGGRDRNRSNY